MTNFFQVELLKISQQIIDFIKTTLQEQDKKKVVIAVSGGIDSAVSLTLLTRALPKRDIFPIFLPFGQQSTQDSADIVVFNKIPKQNIVEHNIKNMVASFIQELELGTDNDLTQDKVRLGNIMARVRMVLIYDLAKQKQALVAGTENKSEKYLGYFTRFGDEASDFEPIQHLYKTQVRALARFLNIPEQFITKAPSAGLWPGQTDEQELGFSYKLADQVMYQYLDLKKSKSQVLKYFQGRQPQNHHQSKQADKTNQFRENQSNKLRDNRPKAQQFKKHKADRSKLRQVNQLKTDQLKAWQSKQLKTGRSKMQQEQQAKQTDQAKQGGSSLVSNSIATESFYNDKIIKSILARIDRVAFKHQVPYVLKHSC